MYTYIPISPPSCISLPPSLSHPSRWSQSTELFSPCDAFFLINLFIYYFWLRWVFVAVRGLSLVAVSGGFSCCGAQALGAQASVVVARGLSSCGSGAPECRLSSCGTPASLLCGMWDLPGPGLEPVSPSIGRQILNHCATREVPPPMYF